MKVCIIGGGLSKSFDGHIVGGAEKQQVLIIKGLKDKGISVIVLEYYLTKLVKKDDINFIPAWKNNNDSLLKRIRDLIRKIDQYNLDIIYVRGTSVYAAILFFMLKIYKSKIKLFWGIAGDHDLTSRYNSFRVKHATSIYSKLNAGVVFNLSSILSFFFSDRIICQTKEQEELCKRISRNKSTVLISNIFKDDNDREVYEENKTADAIWIGKFSGNKGENILLNISQDIPEMKILCLGHVTEEFKKTKVFNSIENQKNLILLGRVPVSEINKYILRTDFVLNTSPSEGLSNVFLEGWNLMKPVISYIVNPNQYLTNGRAGYCAKGNYQALVLKLKSILNDQKFMEYHGNNGNEILKKFHNQELIISKYIKLFEKVV